MPHHAQLPHWVDQSSEQKLQTLRHMLDDLYGYVFAGARRTLEIILMDAEPADEKERTDIQTMRHLLAEHPNIMSPNCEVGHFTGSALVADLHGRVLLHHHRTLGRWLQFGGHAEFEMDFADVAMREAREESGLSDLAHLDKHDPRPVDFDIHTIPARDNRPEHLHLDLRYLLLTNEPDALNPPDGESQSLVWMPYEDLLESKNLDHAVVLDPALKRLIRKCRARINRFTGTGY